MMTVRNVTVPWGMFLRGRTVAEIKNSKGKWKKRKTFVRVTGGAQVYFEPWYCEDHVGSTVSFSEQHSNKSKAEKNAYATQLFKVKSGQYGTLHQGGSGSNFLELFITMD